MFGRFGRGRQSSSSASKSLAMLLISGPSSCSASLLEVVRCHFRGSKNNPTTCKAWNKDPWTFVIWCPPTYSMSLTKLGTVERRPGKGRHALALGRVDARGPVIWCGKLWPPSIWQNLRACNQNRAINFYAGTHHGGQRVSIISLPDGRVEGRGHAGAVLGERPGLVRHSLGSSRGGAGGGATRPELGRRRV